MGITKILQIGHSECIIEGGIYFETTLYSWFRPKIFFVRQYDSEIENNSIYLLGVETSERYDMPALLINHLTTEMQIAANVKHDSEMDVKSIAVSDRTAPFGMVYGQILITFASKGDSEFYEKVFYAKNGSLERKNVPDKNETLYDIETINNKINY